jgi:hypothetical protein
MAQGVRGVGGARRSRSTVDRSAGRRRGVGRSTGLCPRTMAQRCRAAALRAAAGSALPLRSRACGGCGVAVGAAIHVAPKPVDQQVLGRCSPAHTVLAIRWLKFPYVARVLVQAAQRAAVGAVAPHRVCPPCVIQARSCFQFGGRSDRQRTLHTASLQRVRRGSAGDKGQHSTGLAVSLVLLVRRGAGTGESKRLVVESPWSQFTSECQRF